jgi:hypothetical protein
VRIDMKTGVARAIGPIGFRGVAGLAFDPVARVLYGSIEPDWNASRVLLAIDVNTGRGTVVGPTGFELDGLTEYLR